MPMPLDDLTGKRFGRLVVLRRHGTSSLPVKWRCRCDCGTEKTVRAHHLKSGSTKSCGCWRDEVNRRPTSHGHATAGRSATYVTWEAIKQRCHNPNAVGYDSYGGRGIEMCERWRDSFENFLADMGERPEGKTLERVDNDGDYEPDNCRWASSREQASNRRNTRMISYGGREQTLTQWAREYSLSRGVLWHRINLGWSLERALTEPVRRKRR